MEIIKIQLNTTLKCGKKVWEAGVYTAPVPPELLAERGSSTREGVPIIEVLETNIPKRPKIIPFPPLEASTSTSNVSTSNLREGPMFEAEKETPTPQEKRKEPVSTKPKLVLRG